MAETGRDDGDFDYIVVGAGSAGCALAARLAQRGGNRILLLEAGGRDSHWSVKIPAGYYRAIANPDLNWRFETEPERELDRRRIAWPRGRVVGGSSAINGLVYVRGQPEDYDAWGNETDGKWDWRSVEPYFRRLEDYSGEPDPRRGVGGPVGVTPLMHVDPLSRAFVETCTALGWPRNDGFNNVTQAGAGFFELTTRRGLRASTARSYLKQLPRSANLRVQPHALVDRILFDGNRAIGVRYLRGNEPVDVVARREVLISAGAVGSPALLLRSGIGPAEKLGALGGTIVRDCPTVGANLQDHFQARMVFSLRRRAGLNSRGTDLPWLAATALSYAWHRRGPLAIGAGEAGLFASTDPTIVRPDIQVHFLPFSTDAPGRSLHPWPGLTMSVCQLRPDSRGSISIPSLDPREAPTIKAEYLSAELDRRIVCDGLAMLRRIAAGQPLAELIAEEVEPGMHANDPSYLLHFARARGGSIFHPCGTCRMGTDKNSVVDSALRVRGVENLRVADASIMPYIVSGNTNAAAIMIGEKAADVVLADSDQGGC